MYIYQKGGQVGELSEAAVFGAVRAVRAERDDVFWGCRLQVSNHRGLGAAEDVQDVREPHAATRPVGSRRVGVWSRSFNGFM